MEILSIASTLGVGAFLGAVIFIIYRIDRKSSEERFEKLCERDQSSREQNTKALTELTIAIKINTNGRHP